MTVKELRELLYKPNDDTEVQIEDSEIINVILVKDLETGDEVVRLFT